MSFPSLGHSSEDDVTTNSAEVFSASGRTVTLSCNYSVKANNLQWYRQDPGSAPHYLLLITDAREPQVLRATPPNPRLTAELNQERNGVKLQISSAAVTDSAVYYCALRPTVTGNYTTLYKNLWSKDNTPHNRFVCLSWKLQNKQTCGLGVGNKQWYERTDREGGATLSKSRAEKISCCAAFNIYSRHQIVSVRCSLCVTLESCLCFSSSWKVGQSRNNKCLQRICFYKPLEHTVRV